jgi:hypothetical protein
MASNLNIFDEQQLLKRLQNNLELNKTVQQIMDRSLAKGTLTQYECGFNSYKQFLLLAGFSWNDKYESSEWIAMLMCASVS